jgi:tight adherence protein B
VRRWRFALAVGAALLCAAPAAAGVHISGVDTSSYPQVRVTVVTPLGSARPGLTENGTAVVGLRAVNLGRAKSVALAIDRSQSMSGAPLADAAAAARAFVAAKGAADRIEVMAFGHDALALTRFSSTTADADVALRTLTADPRSGTALWDAVVLAAQRLSGEDTPGHVIIVVSDGSDVSSTASFGDAVAAAHHAHASVYAIGIAGPAYNPAPLRQLATNTGGTYHEVKSTAQLAGIYASIGRTLAHSWELTYPTAARPGDTLRLAAAAAGEGSGERTVTLNSLASGTVTPQQPSTLLPRSAWTSRFAPLVVAAIVGLLALLAVGFFAAARSGKWLSARLAPHLGPTTAGPKQRRKRHEGHLLRALFAATDHAFANMKQFRALQRLIARADLPVRAAELLYVCLGCGLLLGLVTAAAAAPTLLILFFMAGGATLPVLFVSFKARARIKAFDNQLPDLLITIAASLKAGHSFRHAVQAVVDEGAEPAAKDFRRVLNETRLGRPMDEALAEMAARVGSKNLTFVLTAVTIQRQIGGSLAGLFDTVAETVRQRQQFARKIRSLTAMGRMSAYTLIALPFGIALALTAINANYMSPLWKTSTGHTMVGVALGMMSVGTILLKKIVSFKG